MASPNWLWRFCKSAAENGMNATEFARIFPVASIPINRLVGGVGGIDFGVGPLKVDDIKQSTTGSAKFGVTLEDNRADAFTIHEDVNPYFRVVTANAQAEVQHGNTTTNPLHKFLGTGAATIGGTLGVTGAITATAGVVGNLTGNASGSAGAIAAAGVYSPAEQTGTGAEQIFAHGLVTTPSVIIATATAGHNGAGAAGTQAVTIAYGVMSATELRFTVSSAAKFRILAVK